MYERFGIHWNWYFLSLTSRYWSWYNVLKLSLGICKSSHSFNIRMLIISSISCHEPYSSLSFWFEKELNDWKKKLVIFPLFSFCLMILELWNIHGSNEMTSLNNIFFKKDLWCIKFNHIPYVYEYLKRTAC